MKNIRKPSDASLECPNEKYTTKTDLIEQRKKIAMPEIKIIAP